MVQAWRSQFFYPAQFNFRRFVMIGYQELLEPEVRSHLKRLTGRRYRRKDFDRVFQINIMLPHTEPPIWRRLHVPATYSLWDLTLAICDSLHWWRFDFPPEFSFANPADVTYTRM